MSENSNSEKQYRFLEVGEVIQEGDQINDPDKGWRNVICLVGYIILEGETDIFRRLIQQPTPDMVNNPPHYTSLPAKCECGKPIECIQVTQHMDFCLGNAVKYLWRAGHKVNEVEDLKKAVWYIQRKIKQLEEK